MLQICLDSYEKFRSDWQKEPKINYWEQSFVACWEKAIPALTLQNLMTGKQIATKLEPWQNRPPQR